MRIERALPVAWALAWSVGQAAPLAEKARMEAIAAHPLRFEPNAGQADPRVKFLSRGAGATLMVTERETYIVVTKRSGDECRRRAGCREPMTFDTETVRMHWKGGKTAASPRGVELTESVSNYLIGNDPKLWRTGVANFAKVELKGVYEGIDMVFYGNQNRLEYDFVVAPGVDPDVIELAYDGVKSMRVSPDGDLILATRLGDLKQHKPVVYQEFEGKRVEVAGKYRIRETGVAFELARYDRDKPVVIDPVLEFSSIIGGTRGDDARGIAADSAGNAYVTGATGSTDFPIAGGGATSGQSFVQKYSPSNALVYSTLIGGAAASGTGTSVIGIAVDGSGQPAVTGQTSSITFPVVNGFLAFNANRLTSGLLFDAFVARLNAAGNGFVYSTYFGGTGDEKGNAIAMDSTGAVYLAGETSALTNFPLKKAFQTTLTPPPAGRSVQIDAFAAKLSPTGAHLFGSYLGGGPEIDVAWAAAAGTDGSMYLGGETDSTNFPTTAGAFDTSKNPQRDAFLTKINPITGDESPATLGYSTYVGGNLGDGFYALAVDGAGAAYAAGGTGSTDFPAAGGPAGPPFDGLLVKMNPAGSSIVYTRLIGGGSYDEIDGIAIDGQGAAFVGGYTTSPNFPVVNVPGNMCSSIQSTNQLDGFIARVNAAGSALDWSGLLCGNADDAIRGVSLDGAGNVWFAGYTGSFDFPIFGTGATPFQGAFGTSVFLDGFVGRISQTGNAPAAPTVTSPALDQIFIVSGVQFAWTPVAGATGYDIQVLDRATRGVVFTGQLAGNGSTSAVIEVPNGFLTFRVRACTGGGFTNCSNYCGRNFQIQLRAPTGAPTITNPANGATITQSTTNFQWTAVGTAVGDPLPVSYDVTIVNTATSALELKIRVSETNTIYTMKSGQYRVQVRACQTACGPAASANFTVQLSAPPTTAPTISSCAVSNNSGVNSLTCTWNAVPGADLYVIQVVQPTGGPGGGALTVAGRQLSETTITLPVPNGAANVVVQGCTGDGCGPFSAASPIAPNFGNPAQPILGTPIGGRAVDTGTGPVVVQFSWNRIAGDTGNGAVKYRLFVQDFSRQAAALDVLTTDNFYAAYFNTASRYDALVIANPTASGAPGVQGPPQGFSTRGRNPNSPTPVGPRHSGNGAVSTVAAGNVQLEWTPIPDSAGSTDNRLYQYFVAVQGEGSAKVTGIASANRVQVPLAPNTTPHSAIMRVCTASANACNPDNNTGWGPWSVAGEGGVTNFTVQ